MPQASLAKPCQVLGSTHMSFAGSSDGLCIPLPSEDEVTNCFIIDDLLANRAHRPQLNSVYKVRTSIITSTTYILR